MNEDEEEKESLSILTLKNMCDEALSFVITCGNNEEMRKFNPQNSANFGLEKLNHVKQVTLLKNENFSIKQSELPDDIIGSLFINVWRYDPITPESPEPFKTGASFILKPDKNNFLVFRTHANSQNDIGTYTFETKEKYESKVKEWEQLPPKK